MMPEMATETGHIHLNENGVPVINNTNTKVVEVVLIKRAHGLTPEQLHEELPHLSLAQIHAALAYYYDHQAELEADIERRRHFAEEMEAQATNQLTRRELEARLRRKGIDPATLSARSNGTSG